ncbi:MAG: tRNA (adenosine(37)-N6)-threonylcarbamoyltransferase complex ATPase subunit type 1 TsaE [Symbiobacteriaceae bacterium]|nr:tRNA (adenosine(37)-N6)-threonylcarbamoyltransferase complex ATPase subunit type 1 TsaE [Symbiobacteriaceae bacterium]
MAIAVDLADLPATAHLAQTIAPLLKRGDFIALCGDLGAGKTTFTQYLLAFYGIHQVNSPTFTLHHTYEAELLIHHLDLYRLEREEELLQLGWDELLSDLAVVIVEWMDKFPGLYPREFLQINFFYAFEGRRALLTGRGSLWQDTVACLSLTQLPDKKGDYLCFC